jgi:hypothetical protein
MYVWTAKAEREYRKKYPGRQCLRIAGKEAKFDGKKLPISIARAYYERGLIKSRDGEIIIDTEERQGRKKAAEMKEIFESRWLQLQFWFRQKNVPSINFVAANMGLGSEVLAKFVRNHGEELAAKYGKLPFFSGGRGQHLSDYWTRVMEAKA